MNSKWPQWWKELRQRVERSTTGEIELTIAQIREEVGTTDAHLHHRGWWKAAMNPDNDAYQGPPENRLHCEPLPPTGDVERIVFRLADEPPLTNRATPPQ